MTKDEALAMLEKALAEPESMRRPSEPRISVRFDPDNHRRLEVEITCNHWPVCFCGATEMYPPGTLLVPVKTKTVIG